MNEPKKIHMEGIESMSESELVDACLERGLQVLGFSIEQLQSQLGEWIKITQQSPRVPTPLLIYAHVYAKKDLCLQPEEK